MGSDENVTVICQTCGRKKELHGICPYCGAAEPIVSTPQYAPQQPPPYVPQKPPMYPHQPSYGPYYIQKKKTFLNRQVEALAQLMQNVWFYIFLTFYFGILFLVALNKNVFETFVGWYALMSYAAAFFLLALFNPGTFSKTKISA